MVRQARLSICAALDRSRPLLAKPGKAKIVQCFLPKLALAFFRLFEDVAGQFQDFSSADVISNHLEHLQW